MEKIQRLAAPEADDEAVQVRTVKPDDVLGPLPRIIAFDFASAQPTPFPSLAGDEPPTSLAPRSIAKVSTTRARTRLSRPSIKPLQGHPSR
jgi:hypothetical protein